MTGMSAFTRYLRITALLLVMACFGVRGAVPAGYMLDTAADGSLIVRLCADSNAHITQPHHMAGHMPGHVMDGKMHHSPEDGIPASDEASGTCPYALSVSFDVPTAAPAFQLPAFFGLPLLGARPYARPLIDRPAIAPLPARGPPVLA